VLALVVVPLASIALNGKIAPAGPILLFETVLLLFPTLVVVPKNTVPPAWVTTTVDDPKIVEFVIVLFWAPFMKRIVLVPEMLLTLVLEIVKVFPAEFNPLIVTLSAPFRSIRGAARSPEIVRDPVGVREIDV
jgi:hypothetical protein